MPNNRWSIKTIYAALISFGVFFANIVVAGSGDPEAARQAWPMIEKGALLVDVRSEEEFSAGHLEGALNIEWNRTDELIAAIGSDKQRPVVFYCRSGNRAGRAISVLTARGYTDIFNATGLDALNATKP